jgi:hypothetical protein
VTTLIVKPCDRKVLSAIRTRQATRLGRGLTIFIVCCYVFIKPSDNVVDILR